MPIELETPIEQPARRITAKEITQFTCDLVSMTVQIRFSYIDQDRQRIPDRDEDHTLSLVDDGHPRFTPEEYASIKAALYRLAGEDGAASGVVK